MASEQTFISRVLITVGIVLVTLLIIALIFFTFDVILSVFAAVLIAILFRGVAELLGKYIPLSEVWLVTLAAVLLLGILTAAVIGLAPSVAEQLSVLRDELPRSVAAAREKITQYEWGRATLEQLPDPQEVWRNAGSAGLLSRVGGIFTSTIGAVGNFFVVLLLSVYFAFEPRFYVQGFARLFPIERRERVLAVLAAIGNILRWWLIGKAASMLFIFLLTWIALSILGVPLALTLGLLAGLLSFIPNFGPIISAIPAILIGFVVSPLTALYVVAIYVGVQLIESNIVTPIIERETVEIPPGLTIIFQLTLAILVGGLGLVLATPLLAVVTTLVQMVYIEDTLGDRETEVQQKRLGKQSK